MPQIEVRSVVPSDLPVLVAIDHSYITDKVWQMDLQVDALQVNVTFRETRLPRSVRLEYPRDPLKLADDWEQFTALLVAVSDSNPVGYISLEQDKFLPTTRVKDLAVIRRLRRQGVGKALLFAAMEWSGHRGCSQMILEMQSKNFPAICLAQKLGFEFCGYNDRHFSNGDIGLFFVNTIR